MVTTMQATTNGDIHTTIASILKQRRDTVAPVPSTTTTLNQSYLAQLRQARRIASLHNPSAAKKQHINRQMLAARHNFGAAFGQEQQEQQHDDSFTASTTPFVDLAAPSSSSNAWSDEALLHDLLMNGSQSAMGHGDLSDLSDFSAAASMSAATTSNPSGSESGGSPLSLRDFIFRPPPQNDSPFGFHPSLDSKPFSMPTLDGTADPALMMGGGMDPTLLGNGYEAFNFAQPLSPKAIPPVAPSPVVVDAAPVPAKPEPKKRRAAEQPNASKATATKLQEIAPAANKRPKVDVQSTSNFTPIMEAGSNSTAKAAIERLKAKRQLESSSNLSANANAPTSQEMTSSNSSTSGTDAGPNAGTKKSKQVAHNAIERRYRTNINDRITALRLAVPALRELRPKKAPTRKKGKGANAVDPDDLVDGVSAATKLNKATILGKATEYIKYLKGREVRLRSENAGLRELVCSLDGGEELLELWENEMEKFVAAGEAAAKLREDEELAKAQAAGSNGAMDEDDDDGDDEEDDDSGSANNKDSPASSNGSRYMMGMFLGATFLGSGAEFAADSNASGGATTPVPAAAQGRVIGVSQQLLRRAAVLPSEDPHHLDDVATHHLAIELLRYVSLVLCVIFVLWPLVSRLLPRRFRSRARRSHTSRLARATISVPVDPARSREMLTKLARRNPDSAEAAAAMRTFVSAPRHRVGVLTSVAREGLSFLSQRVFGMRARPAEGRSAQETAVWLRLLEVETALGPHATRSSAARTHTLLRIRNLQLSGLLGSDSPTSSARVHATLALALARLTPLATEMAEQSWENARRVLLLEEQRREDIENELGEERGRSEPRTAEWMHAVLRISLADALALCPAQDVVASAFAPQPTPSTPFDAVASSHALVLRAVHTSPLLSIADAVTSRALGTVWAQLFASVVRATCAVPLSDPEEDSLPSGETTTRLFLARADALPARLALDVITDPVARAEMTRTIARIAAQAPPGTPSAALAKTTFGAWALMIGNGAVAARVAGNLVSSGGSQHRDNEAGDVQSDESDGAPPADLQIPTVKTSSAAHAFCVFLLGATSMEPYGAPPASSSALDALAAATLGWLAYVRTLALGRALGAAGATRQRATLRNSLRDEALHLRTLLAQARTDALLPHELRAAEEEERQREAATAEHARLAAPAPPSPPTEGESDKPDAPTEEERPTPSPVPPEETGAPAPPTTTNAQDLDASRDVLVDVLACLGARAARGKDPWVSFGDEEDGDSGVEGLR